MLIDLMDFFVGRQSNTLYVGGVVPHIPQLGVSYLYSGAQATKARNNSSFTASYKLSY